MKTSNRSLLSRRAALVFGITATALFTPSAFAQVTGFNQTAAGPWDYNDTANWVGTPTGVINGVWDSSLTLAAAQTVTFGAAESLGTGLSFGYTGSRDLTLRSDGNADRTITLGGDITVAPVSNQTVNIGSTTANQGLNVNLGGNRTFNISTSKTLRFYNSITGGDIVTNGAGTVTFASSATTNGAAAGSSIQMDANSTLYFDSTLNNSAGTTRAASVSLLGGAKISARGNNGVNTVDVVTGNVTIGGGSTAAVPTLLAGITMQPGTKNSLLTIGGLQRVDGGIGVIRGTNLGTNTIASATAGATNVQISGTAPTLVGGGGAAESTNISIVPWLVGGTSITDNGSTFLTYTAANGFRPLDTATEFAVGLADGTTSTNNVKVTATTALTGSTTVNSLLINPVAATTISGGVLNVTSGAVLVNPGNTNVATVISSDLNFGSAQGVLGTGVRTAKFNKISGSGGLVFYSTTNGTWTSDTGANSSDYTGDTYIYSTLELYAGTRTFLPYSTRTGDVYVYGRLNLAQFSQTINGLNGTGIVNYGHSSTSELIIGDNGSNGEFSGTIATSSGFNDLNIVKIGAGTQKLTGSSSLYNRSTTIRGGTLEISALANGGSASSIGGSSNVASNLVINGGTLKYSGAGSSTDRLFQIGETTDAATGTLNASGTGAVNFTNTGSIGFGTNNQTRTLALTGTNTGANTLAATIANNGSGAVVVTKSGTGNWTLSGASSYSGGTSVSAGTLLIANTTGSGTGTGAISVASGAKFGGTGIASGVVTASAFDSVIIAGGVDSVGILTLNGGLTANSGVTFAFDIDGSSIDTIDFGTASLNLGGTVTFDFTSLGSVETGVAYTLFAGSGDWDSVSASFVVNGPAGYSLDATYGGGNGYIFDDATNSFTVQFASVPEPSSIALLGGLGALAFVGLRRRRSA